MSNENSDNGKDTPKSNPFDNMIIVTGGMRFFLGRIAITARAMDRLAPEDAMMGLTRHLTGDWGNVCEEDWQANEDAIIEGGRILSEYRSLDGVRFWVITEANRTVTTILLPEDY